MLQWKFQFLLTKILPNEYSASYTVRVFGLFILLGALGLIVGRWFRQPRLACAGALLSVLVLLTWLVLHLTRPVWLRMATQPEVPCPACDSPQWAARAPGLETAELIVRAGGTNVDRMMLVRIDPKHYRFCVHWDGTASRTAETWQRELHAAVVVSGSYFGGADHAPLTPLRCTGIVAGPQAYSSSHGAFVANDAGAGIIDLKGKDVFAAVNAWPEAMVSYPLLIDGNHDNRAIENKDWLASRNFIGIDNHGLIVIGTTETGFFTLHRLGEFLRSGPLDLRAALNLDGGPLVSQVIRAGGFERSFHGTAEMTDGGDVLRAFWHQHLENTWTNPVVLAVVPK